VTAHVPVLLSSSSVFPEPTAAAFEMAATLGYDGIEVMVWTDAVSQDAGALRGLSAHYGVPVLSVHAPCLLVTQRVWSSDPWERLARAAALAETLGAPTVVVHPPFTWQRDYARSFGPGVARLASKHRGVRFAIENMYPVRMAGREFVPYVPGWDPSETGYDSYTLDLSHCAASRSDALEMADVMGDGLVHVHLGDGTGEGRDEHLVPGRGTQPCGPLLASLADRGFTGAVAVEVNTRRAASRAEREADLAESLAFARRHLAISSYPPPSSKATPMPGRPAHKAIPLPGAPLVEPAGQQAPADRAGAGREPRDRTSAQPEAGAAPGDRPSLQRPSGNRGEHGGILRQPGVDRGVGRNATRLDGGALAGPVRRDM
jgi:sugar phosphate isomerase/epimerase